MKSRSAELLEKSISAMIAAIEVYNKPTFQYREETFCILCVNGWELLLKAYWLKKHSNSLRSLHVYEKRINKDGKKGARSVVKLTRSKNPFTHSADYLAENLITSKDLDHVAWSNISAIVELRDSSVHFYSKSAELQKRIYELGAASLSNYALYSERWFQRDLSDYNLFLMPLAFVTPPKASNAVVLSKEEGNVSAYISSLEASASSAGDFQFSIGINISFIRGGAPGAVPVQITNDPSAPKVQLTERQINDRYPLLYKPLMERCRKRYVDFKVDGKYHGLRKAIESDPKYCATRELYPGNPKSPKTKQYSEAIFTYLDNHYTKST